MSQKNNQISGSLDVEAMTYFPGYQEFFFLFLNRLPFNFGVHLRGRIAKTTLELLSNLSPTKLERRIVELQLLGRFLGYMIFSPNWAESGIEIAKLQTIPLTGGLQQLESLGLSLLKIVDEAWEGGWTISAIPWLTELLSMSKWDALSQTSRPFRQVLANLREIQGFATVWAGTSTDSGFSPSMGIILFSLERLFHEISGFPRLTSLPKATLNTSQKKAPSDKLDGTAVGFTTVLHFSSSPNLEDLAVLVELAGQPTVSKASKKVRPSVVRHTIGISPSSGQTVSVSEAGKMILPGAGESTEPKSNFLPIAGNDDRTSIVTKLVEAFFHQHQSLRDICELAVREELKNAPYQILKTRIRPALIEGYGVDGVYETELTEQVVKMASECLQERIELAVRNAIELLATPNLHPQVLSMATKISASRGMEAGSILLQTIVSNEVTAIKVAKEREQKKAKENSSVSTLDGENLTEQAIVAVDALLDSLCPQGERGGIETILPLVYVASKSIHNLVLHSRKTTLSETSLRKVFASFVRLDQSIYTLVDVCRRETCQKTHNLLAAILKLVLEMSAISMHILENFHGALDGELLVQFVESTDETDNGSGAVTVLLQNLIDARLLPRDKLDDCLSTKDLSDHARLIFEQVTNGKGT